MSRPVRRRVGPQENARVSREVEQTKRQLRPGASQWEPWEGGETFSQDTVTAGTESGPWGPEHNTVLRRATARLRVAGSSSTVVTIKVNGSSVGTVTVASGATVGYATFDTFLNADTDTVTVATTTAGAGAAALTVRLRCGASA